jgi:MFS family permease
MAVKTSTTSTLRAMMLLASLAFFACAYPVSFAWFFAWRVLSGVSGGALMVLAAPTVLAYVPASRRGLVAGVIFMGVGVGVAASGTLVPLLLQKGLSEAWLGLGVISLLLTVIACFGWPKEDTPAVKPARLNRPAPNVALKALYAEYALNAVAWVPHMIFLVDFVARGLGQGIQAGAQYWVLFGIGATVGPLLAGVLADRIGFGRALRGAFIVEAISVVTPALVDQTIWLMVSSMVVGVFVTGTVPLVLGRVHELLSKHPEHQRSAWQTATVGFALFQAAAAYSLSFLFSYTDGNYRLLFIVGASAMLLAFVIDVAAASKKTANSTVISSC